MQLLQMVVGTFGCSRVATGPMAREKNMCFSLRLYDCMYFSTDLRSVGGVLFFF